MQVILAQKVSTIFDGPKSFGGALRIFYVASKIGGAGVTRDAITNTRTCKPLVAEGWWRQLNVQIKLIISMKTQKYRQKSFFPCNFFPESA